METSFSDHFSDGKIFSRNIQILDPSISDSIALCLSRIESLIVVHVALRGILCVQI